MSSSFLSATTLLSLWHDLFWPLLRLIGILSISLFVANLIESLNWTSKMAALARPLLRLGNLSDISSASFTMALFSGISANTMLAEAYENQKISKKELILANLFNSLPTYFLHLPTVSFITAPMIKGAAVIYVGLTLGAALLRTLSILLISRFVLPRPERANDQDGIKVQGPQRAGSGWNALFRKTWGRFQKRIRSVIHFTIPIYILIFWLHKAGIFTAMEKMMATYFSFLPWLTPESMGIITLQIAAEFTAGLAAAGALLQAGSMSYREIILALLVGNILSSPIRAIRHQFPYYAGIFKPKVAAELIFYNQLFRVGSLMIMGALYFAVS
jgi:hypothetical protein